MKNHCSDARFLLLIAALLGLIGLLSARPVLAQSGPCDLLDVNSDKAVSIADVQLVADAWRTSNSTYDVDKDGVVTVMDIVSVAKDIGMSCVAAPFGISMAGEFTDATMRSVVVGAGAQWTRTAVYWSGIEPTNSDLTDPNYPGWGWPDAYLRAALDDGITPVVILWSTPAWAADPSMPANFQDCGPIANNMLDEWAQFAGAFAERYDGDRDLDGNGVDDAQSPMPNIRYVEIWNEPEYDYNFSSLQADDEGGCWGHAPEKYAEALRRAYLVMTQANPDVQIAFGALAYDRFTPDSRPSFAVDGGTGPFRYDFLNQVLQYLWDNYGTDPGYPFFHILSFHHYNDFRNNWDGWSLSGSRASKPLNAELIGKANHLRVVKLAPFGLQDMPLMCSECSLASGPDTPQWGTNRNETLQSVYPAQVLARSMAAGLEVTLWHTLVDPGWFDYGLLRSASPSDEKLAYDTYGVATQYLTDATFDKQLPVSGVDGTGSADIEAYRFARPNGSKLIVLWTDTGERLGKTGTSSITRNMTFGAAHFGTWTGSLTVVERDGTSTTKTGTSSITISIDQNPKFIYIP